MPEITPMMKQYLKLKAEVEDCILFFRLGDFYEMFGEDAHLASKELDLTLTTRDRGKDEEDQTPMCGVPYHSSEAYIARLIEKGYRVAICEQTEDPATAKGLVSREVVRIVSPGAVMDSSMLDADRANYMCSIYEAPDGAIALCFAELSTGEVCATGFDGGAALTRAKNELGRYMPREALINESAAKNAELRDFLTDSVTRLTRVGDAARYDPDAARSACIGRFGAGAAPENENVAVAVGALMQYLADTQKSDLSHMSALSVYTGRLHMELDIMTRRNLEITETMRFGEKKGSLLWVLDKTKTPMGGRRLRSWLERPLLNPVEIGKRQNAVAELKDDSVARSELMLALGGMNDLERLIGRISFGNTHCRDLAALASSCRALPGIKELCSPFKSGKLRDCAGLDTLDGLADAIQAAVVGDPPFSVREGGMIREGYDGELDRLRGLVTNGRGMLLELEERERERSGIKKLKIGYNRVFGYYISVPSSAADTVPPDYIRRQTLANQERYVTEELKRLEEEMSTASLRANALEYEIFSRLRDEAAGEVGRIQAVGSLMAELDALCSLAEAADRNDYCRPAVDMSDVIEISQGRHPVVEVTAEAGLFVPNDLRLDNGDNRVAIITGPNMAGKSTYMRQTALIVLMAQIGSFVPAKSAQIGLVDRIFTRIGAADDLASGQSTFMLEMTEVASILRAATRDSLLILDEIGRGTSTFDGMAIARAVLEYCGDKKTLGAKTMFATHYHELSALEHTMQGVKNFNVSVKKRGSEIIFLRRIVPGGADRSYGVEVARLAGVPQSVIRRAAELLGELENGGGTTASPSAAAADADADGEQLSLTALGGNQIADRVAAADLNTLTPIEALNLLYELKSLL